MTQQLAPRPPPSWRVPRRRYAGDEPRFVDRASATDAVAPASGRKTAWPFPLRPADRCCTPERTCRRLRYGNSWNSYFHLTFPEPCRMRSGADREGVLGQVPCQEVRPRRLLPTTRASQNVAVGVPSYAAQNTNTARSLSSGRTRTITSVTGKARSTAATKRSLPISLVVPGFRRQVPRPLSGDVSQRMKAAFSHFKGFHSPFCHDSRKR